MSGGTGTARVKRGKGYLKLKGERTVRYLISTFDGKVILMSPSHPFNRDGRREQHGWGNSRYVPAIIPSAWIEEERYPPGRSTVA